MTRRNSIAGKGPASVAKALLAASALRALVTATVGRVGVAGLPLGRGVAASLSTLSTILVFIYVALRHDPGLVVLYAVGLGVGLLLEVLGVRYCIPFGCYVYTTPAPKVLGVPLGVPVMWGFYIVLGYTAALAASGLLAAPRAVLLVVAIDIGMEPVATSAGMWAWLSSPGHGGTVSPCSTTWGGP